MSGEFWKATLRERRDWSYGESLAWVMTRQFDRMAEVVSTHPSLSSGDGAVMCGVILTEYLNEGNEPAWLKTIQPAADVRSLLLTVDSVAAGRRGSSGGFVKIGRAAWPGLRPLMVGQAPGAKFQDRVIFGASDVASPGWIPDEAYFDIVIDRDKLLAQFPPLDGDHGEPADWILSADTPAHIPTKSEIFSDLPPQDSQGTPLPYPVLERGEKIKGWIGNNAVLKYAAAQEREAKGTGKVSMAGLARQLDAMLEAQGVRRRGEKSARQESLEVQLRRMNIDPEQC